MRGRVDPLGTILKRSGALGERELQDVLDRQRHTLPFASLCYVLGHASEDVLVAALAKQTGIPGVALDRSVIDLAVLGGLDRDVAIAFNILPLFEDEKRLFVAVEDPRATVGVVRELEFVHGKSVVPHIALHIVLSRTIRACFAARDQGEALWRGPVADVAARCAWMAVVSEQPDPGAEGPAADARDAVVEDVTKEVRLEELLSIEDLATDVDGRSSSDDDSRTLDRAIGTPQPVAVIDLDDVDAGHAHGPDRPGPARVLIVDDDFASRRLLKKELQPTGFVTTTASTGGEAVRMLKDDPPDAVVLDVMLPEVDGFQICRAIKQSGRYRHISVILMSAVIDSGRVTDKVLRQYGADAYFEKPLNCEHLRSRLRELVRDSSPPGAPRIRDVTFSRALELYRDGDIGGAERELRRGIDDDPLSAKHHFVLANLLQKQEMIYEAIDEYETTVDLRPDYFPALTRLAYLYYKKGFSAKAIETWRQSLPFCSDPELQENIEVFMRKLIADMQAKT